MYIATTYAYIRERHNDYTCTIHVEHISLKNQYSYYLSCFSQMTKGTVLFVPTQEWTWLAHPSAVAECDPFSIVPSTA